jgi:hypothetical protein
MTEHGVVRVVDRAPAQRDEPLGVYDQLVDSIGVKGAERSQREPAGRRPWAWRLRPTAARRGELRCRTPGGAPPPVVSVW